uniref:Uncharacterized protein n=1 Tax=Nothobranchius furzeri TaxID=105023 RepID=A0A1A8AWG1_NOTFU
MSSTERLLHSVVHLRTFSPITRPSYNKSAAFRSADPVHKPPARPEPRRSSETTLRERSRGPNVNLNFTVRLHYFSRKIKFCRMDQDLKTSADTNVSFRSRTEQF